MYYGPPAMVVQQSQSNGLGVAGFIFSLVGLLLCGGLLCPLGLLLSFIAMFKAPRGMAVAGFIIGLLGSLWLLLFVVFGGIAFIAAIIEEANRQGGGGW